MTLMLTNDELLVALENLDHPRYREMVDKMEDLGRELVQLVADCLPEDVVTLGKKTEFWDGQTMSGLRPVDPSRPIPEALRGLDDDGWED